MLNVTTGALVIVMLWVSAQDLRAPLTMRATLMSRHRASSQIQEDWVAMVISLPCSVTTNTSQGIHLPLYLLPLQHLLCSFLTTNADTSIREASMECLLEKGQLAKKKHTKKATLPLIWNKINFEREYLLNGEEVLQRIHNFHILHTVFSSLTCFAITNRHH